MPTVLVAMVTAAITAGAPAIAHGVHAAFAHNADKVDGKHAVGSGATTASRKGKLVATSPATGRLPNNIIATAPNAAKLQGKTLAAWDAERVFDGPWPASDPTFTSNGGTVVIFASGSAFRSPDADSGTGKIGVDVHVDPATDNIHAARIETFTNEPASHKALVSEFAVVDGLAAGTHTIRLTLINDSACGIGDGDGNYCTLTDPNDVFHIMVMEIPD